MKAFTDIEQSKKLAKILPPDSADMCYRIVAYNPNDTHVYQPYCFVRTLESDIPCWSLDALFGVIPKWFPIHKRIKDYNVLRIDISDNNFAIWYDEIGYGVNNDLPIITAESAVDACYEMIIKLNELDAL